ncbi:hypothetical protein S1OALGB6SA_742 [Olavius algarvensis spirochete endosymbiont]|uniref:cation:dicarboxylate symporter family transporter n=1 Tax=Olavius algarvensis spirochete endosymbiont TaxID=260710 RepID=UPI00052DD3B1|nr:cation:dicarboxylase symporter family transporter [Olavius algarvensis spirochete endosymbiont]KGM43203.1 hypothetical protein JY97_08870 [Alkalispirochaeta odontotermitis]CAD7844470.1 MAG: hypothetical protein [Olavius algarvensis spirochete endosymbiont]VDA99671.1 hypothetical protein S1OALGB6SA_742 [Olavius algarvensis spirochete endosymbiont]
MKTPYQYLLGISFGIGAGLLLKPSDSLVDALQSIVDMCLHIGRYIVFPLIFFSLPVAVTKLRRIRKFGQVFRYSIYYAIITSLLLTLLGTFIAWVFDFGRLSIIQGTAPDIITYNLKEILHEIFNQNSFRIFVGNPSSLLPLVVPAFILGWYMYYDRMIAEPTFNLFDSIARLLYKINRHLMILMPVMLALFVAATLIKSKQIMDFTSFLPLLATIFAICILLVGVICPLVMRAILGRGYSWKVMAGLAGALLSCFVSGSPMFNYGNLTLHLKNNLHIPRHNAAFIAPLYLMFARAGTAMLSAICMLTVIRSYSSLGITHFQVAWVALFSFLISFALPANPNWGIVAALTLLCSLYGRGLDEGWLILAPIFPLLAMLGSVLDSAIGAIMLVLINRRCEKDMLNPNSIIGVNF